LDKETQEYYDNYFSLFRQKGWKQLINDFGNNAQQINNVEATKDSDDMFFRKGQLNILAYLLNLEPVVTNSYEELTENEDD
jgi:hypothetical protein